MIKEANEAKTQMTEAQLHADYCEDIRRQQLSAPLISDAYALSAFPESCQLASEVSTSPNMHRKVAHSLLRRYVGIRYIRRDGSCFYRAALFRVFEMCLLDEELLRCMLTLLDTLRPKFRDCFSEYAETFCDVVRDLLENIGRGVVSRRDDLLRILTGEEAEYVLFYFRYAVSVYLRSHADDFSVFVEALGFSSVEEFCSREVETVGSEVEQIHIVAFAKAFSVSFYIEYVDASPTDAIVTHSIHPDDASPSRWAIELLYRPGHYDLLYSTNAH